MEDLWIRLFLVKSQSMALFCQLVFASYVDCNGWKIWVISFQRKVVMLDLSLSISQATTSSVILFSSPCFVTSAFCILRKLFDWGWMLLRLVLYSIKYHILVASSNERYYLGNQLFVKMSQYLHKQSGKACICF